MSLTVKKFIPQCIILLVACLTITARNIKEERNYRIIPELSESEIRGGRGNMIDIQPGLYSIIDKMILADFPSTRGHCIVYTDTTFQNCLPQMFNFTINDDKIAQVDTLRYNWANDTICYMSSYYRYRNISAVTDLTWSSSDCVFISNETLGKQKSCMKSYIDPKEIVHVDLNRISGRDSIVISLIKQWDLDLLESEHTARLSEHKKITGHILNQFLRIVIKNGIPIDAQATGCPITKSQLDWVKRSGNKISITYPWEVPDTAGVFKRYECVFQVDK